MKKLSQLTHVADLSDAAIVAVVQGGTTLRTTVGAIRDLTCKVVQVTPAAGALTATVAHGLAGTPMVLSALANTGSGIFVTGAVAGPANVTIYLSAPAAGDENIVISVRLV